MTTSSSFRTHKTVVSRFPSNHEFQATLFDFGRQEAEAAAAFSDSAVQTRAHKCTIPCSSSPTIVCDPSIQHRILASSGEISLRCPPPSESQNISSAAFFSQGGKPASCFNEVKGHSCVNGALDSQPQSGSGFPECAIGLLLPQASNSLMATSVKFFNCGRVCGSPREPEIMSR